MDSEGLKVISKLTILGFEQDVRNKVLLYYEGSLKESEHIKTKKLIEFIENVLDDALFKKRQCAP